MTDRKPLLVELIEPRPAYASRAQTERAANLDLFALRATLSDLLDVREAAPGMLEFRPGVIAGSIAVNDLRVIVRPRLGPLDLATLVRFAHGHEVDTLPSSETTLGMEGLDELVASLFVEELDRIRAVGLSRRYLRRDERPRAVRGAIDFTASFPWRERGMTSVACTFHELSTDVLDNRLLRAALDGVDRLSVGTTTRAALGEHRRAWREIASSRAADRANFTRARAGYQRLNRHYALAHTLAQIIVEGISPVDVLHGTTRTRGIRLNLASLFEKYVERVVRTVYEPRGCVVEDQIADGGAIVDDDGRRYATVRPDLVVWKGGKPVLVIDAKYKDYGRATVSIGNGDLYQLFFYASRLQTRERLERPPLSMIVSPCRDGEAVAASRRRLSLCVADSAAFELRLTLTDLQSALSSLRHGNDLWVRQSESEFLGMNEAVRS